MPVAAAGKSGPVRGKGPIAAECSVGLAKCEGDGKVFVGTPKSGIVPGHDNCVDICSFHSLSSLIAERADDGKLECHNEPADGVMASKDRNSLEITCCKDDTHCKGTPTEYNILVVVGVGLRTPPYTRCVLDLGMPGRIVTELVNT